MSRIFDVARKDGLLDFDEIAGVPRPETGVPRTEKYTPHLVPPFAASGTRMLQPAVPPPVAIRTVSLTAGKHSPLLPFDVEQTAVVEQYRIIRTKLRNSPRQHRLLAVSSPSSGDGKTVTSINLAVALSLKDQFRVLLVDADLRRSSIAEALDLPVSPGVSDVASGAVDLDAALLRAEQFPNLFLLPAGSPAGNAAELLDCDRWRSVLGEMRTRFDCVLFDAPPVTAVADFELLQVACDAVVLVLRPGRSDRNACIRAFEAVLKEKLAGVVLNAVEEVPFWPGTETYGGR